jgi:hypothetical protein
MKTAGVRTFLAVVKNSARGIRYFYRIILFFIFCRISGSLLPNTRPAPSRVQRLTFLQIRSKQEKYFLKPDKSTDLFNENNHQVLRSRSQSNKNFSFLQSPYPTGPGTPPECNRNSAYIFSGSCCPMAAGHTGSYTWRRHPDRSGRRSWAPGSPAAPGDRWQRNGLLPRSCRRVRGRSGRGQGCGAGFWS